MKHGVPRHLFVISRRRVRFQTDFLQVFSVLNLDFVSILPFSCSYNIDFVDTLMVTTLAPIIFGACLAIGFYVQYSIQKNNQMKSPLELKKTLMRRFVYTFLLASFVILPSVTTTIFAMFPCENIDPNNEDNLPDYYLIADLSIECSSDRYKTGQNFAIFMIFVYPIGIPAFYF